MSQTPPVERAAAPARPEDRPQNLEVAVDRPADEVRRILRERARALAQPEEAEEAEDPEGSDLLVFTAAGERYGIDLARVQEFAAVRAWTPVPGGPAVVLGVFHHRGGVLSVLDLRWLLGLPAPPVPEGGGVVIVDAGEGPFGLVAEGAEIVRIAPGEAVPPPPSLAGARPEIVRAITPTMIVVLDLAALASEAGRAAGTAADRGS